MADREDLAQHRIPQLLVCVSCRCHGTEKPPEGVPTDGRKLYERFALLLEPMGDDAPVQIVPAPCFANCERGCSAGIAAPGKWSYLLGELTPDLAEDVLTYARAYANSASGVVLPSGRPTSLAKSVIARFPAQLVAFKEAAE